MEDNKIEFKIVFKIVERMERHVYHLPDEEFRQIYRKCGFNNIVQKRFNFVPLLLTIGVAIKEPAHVIPACEPSLKMSTSNTGI